MKLLYLTFLPSLDIHFPALAWHPVHESMFVSGGGDGSLAYWLVYNEKELGFLEHAHDQAIWTLEWHPLGHILASGFFHLKFCIFSRIG